MGDAPLPWLFDTLDAIIVSRGGTFALHCIPSTEQGKVGAMLRNTASKAMWVGKATVFYAVFLACLVVLLAALASVPAASALSRDKGASFAARCDFSHRLSDDPIKYPYPPGSQGSAHSHDFFGNKSTRYNSTYDGTAAGSVRMIGQPTTCSRPEDTAGYWIPTVSWRDQAGAQKTLTANRAVFYYRAGKKDHRTVQPYAPNLKVINDNRITWYCGDEDSKTGSVTPPTQCGNGVLGLKIVFPDCVAKDPATGGQQSGSADHESHMARSKLQSDGTRACPSTHPIPVPTLTVNINFPVPTTPGTVALSSDHDAPGGSTMHADFWNTWNQEKPLNPNPSDGRSYGGLNALVKRCINEVPPTDPRPTECRAPTASG